MRKISLDNVATLHKDENYQVRVMHISPHNEVVAHYHSACEDLIVGLHGKAELLVDGVKDIINEGDAFMVNKNQVHQISNTSGENFVYLLVQLGKSDFNKSTIQ